MKFHWFGPLAPHAGADLQLPSTLLPRLAERCELEIWTDDHPHSVAGLPEVPVHHGAEHQRICRALNHGGVPIYHLGSCGDAFAQVWAIARVHAGICLLQDEVYQDLLWRTGQPAGWPHHAPTRLAEQYGSSAGNAIRLVDSGSLHWRELEFALPGDDTIAAAATAAMTPLTRQQFGARHDATTFHQVTWPVVLFPSRGTLPMPVTEPVRIALLTDRLTSTACRGQLTAVLEFLNDSGLIREVLFFGTRPQSRALQRALTGRRQPTWRHVGLATADLTSLSAADVAINLCASSIAEAVQLRIWNLRVPSLAHPATPGLAEHLSAGAFQAASSRPRTLRRDLETTLHDASLRQSLCRRGVAALESEAPRATSQLTDAVFAAGRDYEVSGSKRFALRQLAALGPKPGRRSPSERDQLAIAETLAHSAADLLREMA